jgi:hypothetical protein
MGGFVYLLLVIAIISIIEALKETVLHIALWRRRKDMLGTILIVIVILMLVGAIPTWPHSKQWGYYPSGGLGLVLLIIVILLLMGRI